MRVMVFAPLILVLTACVPIPVPGPTVTVPGPTRTITATPSPGQSDSAPEAPGEEITLTGEGATTTARVALTGDYVVSWQTLDDCVYYADLESAEDDERAFAADAATSGTTYLYSMQGEFALSVNTGPAPSCRWSVTIALQ